MVKHYCDVCGKQLVENIKNDYNKVLLYRADNQKNNTGQVYEVCDTCLSKVYQVLRDYDPYTWSK